MNSSMIPWIAVRPPVTAVTALVVAVCAVVQLRATACTPPDSVATRDWNVFALSPYQVPSTALAAPVCRPSMSVRAVPALVKASAARVAPPVSPSSLARWSRIGLTNDEMKPATSATNPFPSDLVAALGVVLGLRLLLGVGGARLRRRRRETRQPFRRRLDGVELGLGGMLE